MMPDGSRFETSAEGLEEKKNPPISAATEFLTLSQTIDKTKALETVSKHYEEKHGCQLPMEEFNELVKKVEEKIKALKDVLDKDDMDVIKKATDDLSEKIQKVGAAMYRVLIDDGLGLGLELWGNLLRWKVNPRSIGEANQPEDVIAG